MQMHQAGEVTRKPGPGRHRRSLALAFPRVIVAIAWLVMCLPGCRRPLDGPPRPEGVLPESTMVRLQADIHVAEAELSLQRGEYAASRLAWDTVFEGVLARHGTDTATYQRSFRYYAANVERLDEIYRQVLDSLAARDR